jgi:hypothetical protein
MSQSAPREPRPDEASRDVPPVIEIAPLPPLTGDPADRRARLLAAIGSRKGDRAYLDSLEQEAAAYRRSIQERETEMDDPTK